jgi:hypothetical protein
MTDKIELTNAGLQFLKSRIDRIFNEILVDMKPGWDDSVEGFNKAWRVIDEIFKDEIRRVKDKP